jgi:prepilin-type N-terminal cleavage/methylation domain-containing protein
MRTKQKGFSLIELLIVVAIILIIAAIAIPNLIRSRMAANEASAVACLRTLTTAFVSYSSTYGNGNPPDLNSLQPPAGNNPADCAHAGLVDGVLSGMINGGTPTTFTKSGYKFTYIPAGTALTAPTLTPPCTAGGWPQTSTSALPVSVGGTGSRGFLIDNTGVIYFTTNGTLPAVGGAVL